MKEIVKGVFYDNRNSSIVKLSNEMFIDFDKCCIQEKYTYTVIEKSEDSVICRADNHIIEFFIRCMKSEHEETIKMLCSVKRETLLNRINDTAQDNGSKNWIDLIDIELINEAIQRYDEPEFIKERTEMMKAL